MMRRIGLIAVGFAMLAGIASTATAAENRVALVIGNSKYRNIPSLANPAGDARMVADTLKSLGFKLVGDDAQFDLDKSTLDTAIRNFGSQMQGADVSLFYYAGHGVQVRGANYLVPVSANPTREADVDFELEDVSLVLRQMEAAGTRLNLVMLDACRNNPFGGRGLRTANPGLAQIRAPEGTLVSFATQPGNVALDGEDGQSPYSRALVQTIRQPGLGVFDAFNEVGLRVKKSTGGMQQPWVSSSPIDGSFYFAGMRKPDVSAPAAPVALAPMRPQPVIEQAAFATPASPEPTVAAAINMQQQPKVDQKVAIVAPPARPAPAPAQKPEDERKSDRGVSIYNGRWHGSVSGACPHETGGYLNVKDGVISGDRVSGRITADGRISGRFISLLPGRFSGRMQSASEGGGSWWTGIGCDGSWNMVRR